MSEPTLPPPGDRVARPGLVGPFRGRQIAAGALTLAVVAAVIILATAPLGSTARPSGGIPRPTAYLVGPPGEDLAIGRPAPELTVRRPDGTTLQLADLQGRPIRLADLRGKAVWINFWASWCPPCQAETPVLREMDGAFRDRGLVIVGISVQEATAADVGAYAARYDLRYPIAADLAGDIFHLYRVRALPTQFFIDASGVLVAIVQGPLDVAGATAQIEAILPR